MKLYAICCEVFVRECSRAAGESPHVVTTVFQSFGLHDRPDDLRKTLQKEIDRVPGGKYDYILVAYGLCSRGTADLVARDTPLVIPRAHDCITLLLGSQDKYREEFEKHPGTYYYSPGWIERKEGDVSQGVVQIVQDVKAEERFQQYVEKYGEDNARYLLELESSWLENYNRAAFLNIGMGDQEFYRQFTRQVADSHRWSYEEVAGDTKLIDRLLGGDWDPAEFLIVQPEQRTAEDIGGGVITAF